MDAKENRRRSRLHQIWKKLPRYLPTRTGTLCLLRLLAGGLLSRSLILNGCAPFGLGWIAASGSGMGGLCALIGGCVGYLAGMGFADGGRYAAAAGLVYALSYAFYDLKLRQKQYILSSAAALSCGCTAFLALSPDGWTGVELTAFLTETALAGISCWFYLLLEGDLEDRPGAVLFLTATLLIHCTDVLGYGLCLAGGTVAVLFAARHSAGAAAVTGGVMGLAVMLSGGSSICAGVLTFAGLMAGSRIFSKGRFPSAAAFLASALLAVLWYGGGWAAARALALGAALWLMVPEKWMLRCSEWVFASALSARPVEPSEPTRSQVQFRLEEQSTAFQTLYERIRDSVESSGTEEKEQVIFDRTCERICQRCPIQERCWQRNYRETWQALTEVLEQMKRRGRCELRDLPEDFRKHCLHAEEFCHTANEELYAYWNRRQYRSRLRSGRRAVCRQYAQLSRLLGQAASTLGESLAPDPTGSGAVERLLLRQGYDAEAAMHIDRQGRRILEITGRGITKLSKEDGIRLISAAVGVPMEAENTVRSGSGVRLTFRERPPLAATVSVAAKQKSGQSVSGDNGGWFRDEDGQLWVMVCDGMGSGKAAAAESRLVTGLLQDFIHAGVDPTSALNTLAGALSLRGEPDGAFSTVDLMRIDLYTGQGESYKLGAAPSYLCRQGRVSRFAGSSLPAGLGGEQDTPDVQRFHLCPDDVLVLISDGVADSDSDAWLRKLLTTDDGSSLRTLALSILEAPQAQRSDDRTAVVVRLSSRVSFSRKPSILNTQQTPSPVGTE